MTAETIVQSLLSGLLVQIFSTFGLAILMRGLAQLFLTPDYRSIQHAWTSGRTFLVGGVYLPAQKLS
jgi:branched-chain amino acid transport system permease protein